LASAIADQSTGVIADSGFDVRPAAWKPPAVVTEDMRNEARSLLPAIDAQLAAAPQPDVELWLATLGALTARRDQAMQDVQIRLRAYASMMTVPAGCLTQEVLARAGRKFTWFPAYAEVAEFIEAEAAKLRAKKRRLERIAEAKAAGPRAEPKPRRWADLTDDERAAADAKLAQLKAASPASVVRAAAKKMVAPDLAPEEIERNRQRMLAEMAADPDFAEVLNADPTQDP
jgi:hypothetical protein